MQQARRRPVEEEPFFSPNDFEETAQEQRELGRVKLAQMLRFAAAELQELRTLRVHQGWGGDG